ncbi:MAG TPA: phytoene/squalene synthase family protein [Caulobacteraceae bacterium]|nr:phytoene/squalene synthase family protein [Caulobacteraceae bacterium]
MSDASLEQVGRETIQKGSKSFAAAAALFDAQTRADAEMLYAWCRHCDDVIDGQDLGHGMSALDPEAARARLEDLYGKTRDALAGRPVADPAFAAFQKVAARRHIPERYAIDLIDGFAMDVAERRYESREDTLDYCYHVAGVVGVMMALVMGVKPDDLATLRRAQDLGLAFQLTNIARDVVEDARNGRVYLPAAWLAEAGVEPTPEGVAHEKNRAAVAGVTQRLLAEAEPYYASALDGLPALPFRCAWAIGAARGVYRQIGVEVERLGAKAWDERVSTSTAQKVGFAFAGLGLAIGSRGRRPRPRPDLWSKI